MAQTVKKFREIVFQLLYSCSFNYPENEGAMALVMRQNAIPRSTTKKAMEEVESVRAAQQELDGLIRKWSDAYAFDRIPRVEKAILRLSLFEFLHTDLPPKVIISEAIRLAKKYATVEGASFINALLDSYYKEKESAENLSEKQVIE